MNTIPNNAARSGIGLLCLLTLCIILTAGLWPFRPPTNDVSWNRNGHGLHFGAHGSAFTAAGFSTHSASNPSEGTLELSLAPAEQECTHTILSFDGLQRGRSPFGLQQRDGALRVLRHNVDERGTYRTAVFDVDNVFVLNRRVIVTVVLGVHRTSVYVDGHFAGSDAIGGTSDNNFTGRLVLGDSSLSSDSWSGDVYGVGVYGRNLASAEILSHSQAWASGTVPTTTDDGSTLALYRLSESAGATARNDRDPKTSLNIPARYSVLHPVFLLAPWIEYRPTLGYWADFGVNVGGFVPFGLCVVACLSTLMSPRGAPYLTITLGFLTSLTIESLQVFLPTRSSGITDLVTNTTGTVLGVLLFQHWQFARYGVHKAARLFPYRSQTKEGEPRFLPNQSTSVL